MPGLETGFVPDAYVDGLYDRFTSFLTDFSPADYVPPEDDATQPRSYLAAQLEHMVTSGSTTLAVEYPDLRDFDYDMAAKIVMHYERAEPLLRLAIRDYVREHHPAFLLDAHGTEKQFFIGISKMETMEKFRELRTEKIGRLVSFCGTVTRTSEVRPELFLGTFKCQECSTIIQDVEQFYKFTQPLVCSNPQCNNKRNFMLDREASIFVDWQRLKVQENVEEIPGGSLPRTMEVVVRSNVTDRAKPGDRVMFTGQLVVVPDAASLAGSAAAVSLKPTSNQDNLGEGVSGLKGLGAREMMCRLMFIACSVASAGEAQGQVNIRSEEDLDPEQVLAEFGEDAAAKVLEMSQRATICADLAKSVCPAVYGHEAVKTAILLMLLGGVHKTTKEGIKLRGDINVAIVGDPSTAKSQLLKWVASFLPRAVYTSGKASTAAGLTASVVREPENNEFAIEAGALMLADNGVCCIDEFDKMDVKDQVAIHEAMEQQTISIAKAGIQATLNARASILAAANPVHGVYDKSKNLKQNLQLPPAILSRFDLLHIMLDETDAFQDERIARHIMAIHRDPKTAAQGTAPFKPLEMQQYIRYVRALKPRITQPAQAALVRAFKRLRSEDAAPGTSSSYRITVRQLEALIRLSEATARAHAAQEVTTAHVKEAVQLLRASILKVDAADLELAPEEEEAPDLDLLAPAQDAALADLPRGPVQQQQAGGGDVDMQDAAAAGGDENNPAAANVAGGGDAAAGGAKQKAAAGGGQEEQQQPQRQAPRLSAQKFAYMKSLLVNKVAEVDQEQRAPHDDAEAEAAAAAGALAAAEEAGAGEPELEGLRAALAASDARVAALPRAGIAQKDLVDYYLTQQISRGSITTMEQGEEEYGLAFKVIAHLIKKEGLLEVVATPAQLPGEDLALYSQRRLKERRLALSANYVPETA